MSRGEKFGGALLCMTGINFDINIGRVAVTDE
jgi:hypothetical protein